MSSSDLTGNAGVHGVGEIVNHQLKWLFRVQFESDRGINAHLEVLSGSQYASGRLIGMQIKADQSWSKLIQQCQCRRMDLLS